MASFALLQTRILMGCSSRRDWGWAMLACTLGGICLARTRSPA